MIFFDFIILVVLLYILFIATRWLIMVWNGCSKEQAENKIHEIISNTPTYHIAEDNLLINELWAVIQSVIGNERFSEIQELSNHFPVFEKGNASNLPYIIITVPYLDDTEKLRLQKILESVVIKHLKIHGFCGMVLSTWGMNDNIQMPALMIQYAETGEELQLLKKCSKARCEPIISKYNNTTKSSDNTGVLQLGFDYEIYLNDGEHIILKCPVGHLIVVGGSGSGKSTAILYWLANLKATNIPIELYIMDFKASHEFRGITDDYAEFEDCYVKIMEFYEMFKQLQEGGDGTTKILIIDEIAGLLTHFSMKKDEKKKADDIRAVLSSILMLGRSRNCYVWLAMQRYTATIFPPSSGAVDNFNIRVGLGNLTVDGRSGLFAGEHLEDEDKIRFGRGNGLLSVDGQQIKGILIPNISKQSVLSQLQIQE